MNSDFSFKDIIFILIFSVVIFFGAVFISDSLKKKQKQNQVSIKTLEQDLNKNINKKLQRLHTKNEIFKSKTIQASEIVGDDLMFEGSPDEFVDDSASNNAFKLNVFESKEMNFNKKSPNSISEKIMAQLESERNAPSEKKSQIEAYKRELVEKARRMGWQIEVNDELEVTSAKRL